MGSLCGCCIWFLLLLAGCSEIFCGIITSLTRTQQNSSICCSRGLSACWARVGKCFNSTLNHMFIAFVWLYVSWFHSQRVWVGRVICYVIMGNSSCAVGRPSLIRVCWESFGAWLLGRSQRSLFFLYCLGCFCWVGVTKITSVLLALEGRTVPFCTAEARLPTSACAFGCVSDPYGKGVY